MYILCETFARIYFSGGPVYCEKIWAVPSCTAKKNGWSRVLCRLQKISCVLRKFFVAVSCTGVVRPLKNMYPTHRTETSSIERGDFAPDAPTRERARNMCQALECERPAVPPHINRRAVFTICFANCAHFYSMASIFSYAGILAVDLGWAPDEDHAGFVAGLLPTVLILGRLPTSILWGHLADCYGRRPALAFSMVSVALGNLCFGLATNLAVALVVRLVLLGAGNGYVSLMGLLCLELGGEKRQADLFSWVISAGSVVAMAGPAVGGFTYGALGMRYPALAPSLIGAVLGALATVFALVWLPETGPVTWRMAGPRGKPQPPDSTHTAAVLPASVPKSSTDPDAPAKVPTVDRQTDGRGLLAIACQWPLTLALLLRTGHGMTIFAIFDVVPLWCIASLSAGGLAFSEEQVGTLLALAAAGQLVYTSLAMGKVVNLLGQRRALIGAKAGLGATDRWGNSAREDAERAGHNWGSSVWA